MDRFVRYAALTGYADLARACGLDPAAMMARVGLDVADLATPDRWVPAVPVARLLELSASESRREDFGVRLSGYRRMSALGPLSVVLREEPDLRSALDLLTRYTHAYNGILELRLLEVDGLATVQVWVELGRPVPLRQTLDLTIANLLGTIRALVRADWQPLSVCFAHGPPEDLSTFHQVFGPGVRFDSDFTGIVLRARDLDAPTLTSDPAMRHYARLLLDTVGAPRPTTVADQVAAVIEVLLPMGRCSTAQVGRALGLQPRTMHRRLTDEGTSFSAIVHTTRARWAERYLSSDARSLTEVSQLLGFAAPGAFSTWFRQQFGITATEWRQRARSAPVGVGSGIPDAP